MALNQPHLWLDNHTSVHCGSHPGYWWYTWTWYNHHPSSLSFQSSDFLGFPRTLLVPDLLRMIHRSPSGHLQQSEDCPLCNQSAWGSPARLQGKGWQALFMIEWLVTLTMNIKRHTVRCRRPNSIINYAVKYLGVVCPPYGSNGQVQAGAPVCQLGAGGLQDIAIAPFLPGQCWGWVCCARFAVDS